MRIRTSCLRCPRVRGAFSPPRPRFRYPSRRLGWLPGTPIRGTPSGMRDETGCSDVTAAFSCAEMFVVMICARRGISAARSPQSGAGWAESAVRSANKLQGLWRTGRGAGRRGSAERRSNKQSEHIVQEISSNVICYNVMKCTASLCWGGCSGKLIQLG